MKIIRILYAATEISPFINLTKVADFVKNISISMEEREMEIRMFVPKFGFVNDRKNNLHEVVRLSGTNIRIGNEDKPVLIKVATIPKTRLQVYFIDNEDFFYRKYGVTNKEGKFYDDNYERMIFFCKGVIETVKKLGWSPQIIHCIDWMTALIPFYMNAEKNIHPAFKDAKSIFSIYDNRFDCKFPSDLIDKVNIPKYDESCFEPLKTRDYSGLIKFGMKYANAITNSGSTNISTFGNMSEKLSEQQIIKTILEEDQVEESYFNLYNSLVS